MRADSNRKLLLLLHDNPQRQQMQSNSTQAAADDSPFSTVDGSPVHFDSSSMAVTALILLSALFFLGFFSVYARRFCAADNDDNQSHGRPRRVALPPYRGRYGLPSSSAPGLDPLAVRALPLLSYTGDGKEPQPGCVVCLSEFEEKETVKAIPGCGHVFHPGCIDAWLMCHGSCPICRSTQLFRLSSGRSEVGVGVGGGVAHERSAGEDGIGVELVGAMDVEVEVAGPEGSGGPEETGRGRQIGEEHRSGRSDRWCCGGTAQSAAALRRTRSF